MAMGHIRDNAHDIISVSHNVTVDMNDSIKAVNASSKKIQSINNKVQDFLRVRLVRLKLGDCRPC